jgi:hypothetical protein
MRPGGKSSVTHSTGLLCPMSTCKKPSPLVPGSPASCETSIPTSSELHSALVCKSVSTEDAFACHKGSRRREVVVDRETGLQIGCCTWFCLTDSVHRVQETRSRKSYFDAFWAHLHCRIDSRFLWESRAERRLGCWLWALEDSIRSALALMDWLWALVG